jgi:SEFIR domain-containing protein
MPESAMNQPEIIPLPLRGPRTEPSGTISVAKKVFISYSHDSAEHLARVRELAVRLAVDLKADGFQVTIDQFTDDPDEGWPTWCEKQLEIADKVLVAITDVYRRRYDGQEAAGSGRGATFEACIIRQQLYDVGARNPKFRAILFAENYERLVPDRLRGNNLYRPLNADSYQQLLTWLRRSAQVAEPIGAIPMPPPIIWPQPVDDYQSRLADRKIQFTHFKQVLSGKISQRILLLRGPSNQGKTALLSALGTYCALLQVPVSYVDLKGCPTIENVLDTILFDLGPHFLPGFHASQCLERSTFKLLSDLQHLRKPLVLALDTYQDASNVVRKWVEGQLLPRLDRTPAVIVVLCGHEVPEPGSHLWGQIADLFDLPAISVVDDWVDYAYREVPDAPLKREHVEALTFACNGNPGQISALIRRLASQLKPTWPASNEIS